MKMLAIKFSTLCSLLMAAPAISGDFVLRCDEPVGVRADYPENGKTKWSEDGFRNVRPTIIVREKDEFVLVKWGSMIPDELLGQIEHDGQYEKAIVTHRDENQVQAVNRYCSPAGNCLTELYGIFPKLGFLSRLDTSYQPAFGSAAAKVVTTQCEARPLNTAK